MKVYVLEEKNTRESVLPMVFTTWDEGYKELTKRYERTKKRLEYHLD